MWRQDPEKRRAQLLQSQVQECGCGLLHAVETLRGDAGASAGVNLVATQRVRGPQPELWGLGDSGLDKAA